MKASIRDGCIGCGICGDVCPDVFELGEDGLAHVHGEITADNQAAAEQAKNDCPLGIIELSQD